MLSTRYAPRRPDPYYHPPPLAHNYSGYGPETYYPPEPRPAGRRPKSAVDDHLGSDEGIHSLGEDQGVVTTESPPPKATTTLSSVGTDVGRNGRLPLEGTPPKSKPTKSADSKSTSGPSPQRTFYTFEKVREGIMNYVQHLRIRVAELTEKFERGFLSQYGTVNGRFREVGDGPGDTAPSTATSPLPNTNPISLEKRIKNCERLLKHLEYHCTKVDKLYDDYLQNHKLREGAKAMSFAYCDPGSLVSSTKSMKESLQNLDLERKTCEITMCGIENKLQELMGTYHFCIKEIAGFARIGSGDQFEIVIRYGPLKKFKARCKVNRKLEQHWDKRGAAYPCLIHDVMELKAKELKTFGKNAQLIRTPIDPIDMLSIVPILKFVKLNQNGSLKLNMLFFWNPLGNEPTEELEYLYGQQFIDSFLSTPTPSEFQLPFLPVLDNVASFKTFPARLKPGPVPNGGHQSMVGVGRRPAPELQQPEPLRAKRVVRKTLSPYLYNREEEVSGVDGSVAPLDFGANDARVDSRMGDMTQGDPFRGPGLRKSYVVEEQVAGYDFGEPRQQAGTGRSYHPDAADGFGSQPGAADGFGSQPGAADGFGSQPGAADGFGSYATNKAPAQRRPFSSYEPSGGNLAYAGGRQAMAQPYAVQESFRAQDDDYAPPQRGRSDYGSAQVVAQAPSPVDYSLGRDFGLALSDVSDALRAYDEKSNPGPVELDEVQTMLRQFRAQLRDSSPDKGRQQTRRKKTPNNPTTKPYANGSDGLYLGSFFRKNVPLDDYGGKGNSYGGSGRPLEDKRRTYNFESTPNGHRTYEEEDEKVVVRRPDSRNVDMALKSFDFLGPHSTSSRNTALNLSRDTLEYETESPSYFNDAPNKRQASQGQNRYYNSQESAGRGAATNGHFGATNQTGPGLPGRKTPIDSGIESGSLEGDHTPTGYGQRAHGPSLTTGDPNVDRVIHIHLVLLAQGLQKLSVSLDKPLIRARLLKLINVHALCLEILYEIVVHGVPQDEKVIVAIVNKYSNLNGWGNVNQIVDFWKRMNPSPLLLGHVYRIQTNLERHYLPFLLEKHSQQVISLVFPKEIGQIQEIVPGALKATALDNDDDSDGVRHYVTLLQFVLYLKMRGIQDFKVHLEEIARELEFRDLFATGNQNGIIKFLLSLRNDLPPGDSFDIICRLLCNNEEINRFTVSYLNRVHGNFRVRATAVSQALTCLESNESIIRCGACRALQHLKATECIPQLMKTFEYDPNFRVKEFARIALLNMGPAGIRAYDEILSHGPGPAAMPSADYDGSRSRRLVPGSGIYDIDSKL